VRANVSFDGAKVTYNVYQDGAMAQSGFSNSNTDVDGLTNNVTYEFSVSASYGPEDESIQTDVIELTPQAQTVHEEAHDDGSAESEYSVGSGGFTAVKYTAQAEGEDVVRFKWYQNGDGGAFYIKIFEDDNGMPGNEIYSAVLAGNFIVEGWNTHDLSDLGISVSGDFWVGMKALSSTLPFGLDTSGSGNSMAQPSGGAWTGIDGNLMIRVFLDCGENCSDDPGSCTTGDVNTCNNIKNINNTISINIACCT
jgi:hypothetical protein